MLNRFIPHDKENDPLFRKGYIDVAIIGANKYLTDSTFVYYVDSNWNCHPFLRNIFGKDIVYRGTCDSLRFFSTWGKGAVLQNPWRFQKMESETLYRKAADAHSLVWSNEYSGTPLLRTFALRYCLRPGQEPNIIRNIGNYSDRLFLVAVNDIYLRKGMDWQSAWFKDTVIYTLRFYYRKVLMNNRPLSAVRFTAAPQTGTIVTLTIRNVRMVM